MTVDEVFGTPDQQRMQRRGAYLMQLLGDDPRFCCHGRGVQVAADGPEAVTLTVTLARLLGVSACEDVAREKVPAIVASLEDHGLKTDVIAHYRGGKGALSAARARVAARPLPPDLDLKVIDAEAPRASLDAFAEVSLPHGVLPPEGSVMRGVSRPGFAMVAFDGQGRPVATAGSVLNQAKGSPLRAIAQWGQLSTVADRQGEGIAKTMGALAIIHAWEALGARGFKTGISKGNAASAALCAALGVTDSSSDIVAAMDPEAFGAAKLTA